VEESIAERGTLCFSSINHPQHYENENKKGRKSNKKYQNTMWILILISAIFWAIICYILAQKKDKDKGIAFVMGLIFGLFAVIYYAVCSEGSFRCPFCQGQIRSGVKVCKHCGKEIEWK